MPSYSIGKQQKRASFVSNNNVPGVGTYEQKVQFTSKIHRGPTYKIGKQQRLKTNKLIGPGPNTYNLTKQSFFADRQRGFHIIGKVRQRIKSQGPGPANYNLPRFESARKFSFGIKNQNRNSSNNFPGPGLYDPEKVRYSTKITFQKSQRPSLQKSPQSKNPGPGYYSSKGFSQTKNKFSFPKKEKFFEDHKEHEQKQKIPAPGQYRNINVDSLKRQIVSVKFGKTKRDYLGIDINIPGPGAYSPSSRCRKRSPVAIIGNSPKQIKNKDQIPGPASYNVKDVSIGRKQPSVIIGRSSREMKQNDNFIKVGPGSYNIDCTQKGRAYSISARHSPEKIPQKPDPISYSPKFESQFRRTQMTIIGKDKKFLQPRESIPGPGTYHSQQLKSRSKTFYFPKQMRKENTNNNPGPGAYQIK